MLDHFFAQIFACAMPWPDILTRDRSAVQIVHPSLLRHVKQDPVFLDLLELAMVHQFFLLFPDDVRLSWHETMMTMFTTKRCKQ